VIGTRLDKINSLSQTRARMSAEATRIRGEADSELRRQGIANEQIISFVLKDNLHTQSLETPVRPMEVGYLFNHHPLAPDGYKGRHLQNLNSGISRLNASINHQVGAMYRDSQKMQEEQLRIYREKSQIIKTDDDDEDNSFDLRM
jgi:hypothetical protein